MTNTAIEEQNIINICLACDDKYARHAGVVIASILKNANENDNIVFHVLDGGIKEENKHALTTLSNIKFCEVKFLPIDDKLFDDYKKVKTHKYVSLATYYRLKLPSLLPTIKKVIYFDCDFVVNTSLNEIYNTDLEGFAIAGILDIKKKMQKVNPTYVNAGMLIFDIEKMKELELEQKFLKWTQENLCQITCGDQEIINEVCKGQIKILDDEWNVQSSNFINRSSYTKKPKGIHFTSKRKPWNFGSYSYHRDYYFKYLQLTPWAQNKWNRFIWKDLNQIVSLIKYIFHRPLFLFRPKFYQAFYYTYIKKEKA